MDCMRIVACIGRVYVTYPGVLSSVVALGLAGQHLLSAVCDEVAGADTISWELHPRSTDNESSDSVCIDLAVPALSSEQLRVRKGSRDTCIHVTLMFGTHDS